MHFRHVGCINPRKQVFVINIIKTASFISSFLFCHYHWGEKIMAIGMPEIIVILVIVLILFGPKKLPELARAIGRSVKEYRKASNERLKG